MDRRAHDLAQAGQLGRRLVALATRVVIAAGVRHPLEDVLALDAGNVHLDAGLPAQASRAVLSPIYGRQGSLKVGVIGPERPAADRKSTRLNSSHSCASRIPSSA